MNNRIHDKTHKNDTKRHNTDLTNLEKAVVNTCDTRTNNVVQRKSVGKQVSPRGGGSAALANGR